MNTNFDSKAIAFPRFTRLGVRRDAIMLEMQNQITSLTKEVHANKNKCAICNEPDCNKLSCRRAYTVKAVSSAFKGE